MTKAFPSGSQETQKSFSILFFSFSVDLSPSSVTKKFNLGWPALLRTGLDDTCGVNNLHGMPGIIVSGLMVGGLNILNIEMVCFPKSDW